MWNTLFNMWNAISIGFVNNSNNVIDWFFLFKFNRIQGDFVKKENENIRDILWN